MIEDEVPQPREAVFGDNSGDMLVVAREDLREVLHERDRDGKTFAQRRDEFVTSASRQVVKDRESAGAAGDTILLAREVWAMIDAERRERSDPYREVHLALSEDARAFWEPVDEAMKALRAQIDAWTDEEDQRVTNQRAEQQAAMAAMRAKAAPAPEPGAPPPRPRAAPPAMKPARRAKIRGDLGATISAKDSVEYEIEDFSLLPDHILKSPTVVAAILTVVKSTARHMGVPAGIRTIVTTGNQIR